MTTKRCHRWSREASDELEGFVRLQISIRECGDVSILDFGGRATIGRESEFLSKQLRNLFANGERKLLLNLANLAQIDSSGISIIVEHYVFLKRQGGSLKFAPSVTQSVGGSESVALDRRYPDL